MVIVKKDAGVWLNNDVVLRLQVDDSPDPLTELRRLLDPQRRLRLDLDKAFAWGRQPGQNVQEGRLARTRGAQDDAVGAGGNLPGVERQHRRRAIAVAQPLDPQSGTRLSC